MASGSKWLAVVAIANAVTVAGWAGPAAAATPAGRPPNLVILLVDDMGYGDIGCFGSTLNKTPNCDRLAAEGTRLTDFYAAPVCTPSRASLMTGCYPPRVSMPNVIGPDSPRGLSADEHTLAALLHDRGYATECVGKWHLGDQVPFLPTHRGFDHYLGLPYSNDMGGDWDGDAADARPGERSPPLPLVRDETVIETLNGDKMDKVEQVYTDEAVRFIHDHADHPFFLYLAHTAVHVPLHPGDAFKHTSRNGKYGDWIQEMDASTGRVMAALHEARVDGDTLVLFTSDNGGNLFRPHDDVVSNGPLRGGKRSTYEGGVREPTMVWWPGHVPAGRTVDAVTAETDVLPTFVALAGGTVPTDKKIDGADLTPLLLNRTDQSPDPVHYYFAGNRLEAVRRGPWKLAIAPQADEVRGPGDRFAPPSRPPFPKLYNLADDVAEATDVAPAHPDEVRQLQALVATMAADLGLRGDGPGVRRPGMVRHPVPLLLKK